MGAAVYVNLVEHPARMACGTLLAATEFAPSYKRAAIMQGSLAASGFIASVAAGLQGECMVAYMDSRKVFAKWFFGTTGLMLEYTAYLQRY